MAFKRIYSSKTNKEDGVRCDQTVKLTGHYAKKNYPDKLRRIKYYDKETKQNLVFLTNNFVLDALLIAKLYKERWKIELFFKWLKQHLRIKAFYGTSQNAVYTQIWIAISVYVLIAIIKKQMSLTQQPYTILQVLSITLFEKMPLNQVFETNNLQEKINDNFNQLNFF